MQANSTNLLDLPVTDSPRRSWLLRFWIVGCLLATSFCVFKGLEASSSTKPTTTRQSTVMKEVRRQTRMDEIKVGDVVLARDEFGDTVAPKKVTRVFRRTSDHLRLLTFESRDGTRQTLKTTDEHPFALADSLDFVPAGELTIGTEVPGPNGERQTLVTSIREEHPEGIPVFNFEVEGFHTYFVSSCSNLASLLVHNTCVDRAQAAAARHGGVDLGDGRYEFPSRVAARRAASEILGDMGPRSDLVPIKFKDFDGGPWWMRNSDQTMGRETIDGLKGWRDDFLGHSFNPAPHVNVWVDGIDFHLYY